MITITSFVAEFATTAMARLGHAVGGPDLTDTIAFVSYWFPTQSFGR